MESENERIESKIAYLEQALQELGDVVYRQQREIDGLKQRLAVAQDQLEHLRSEGVQRPFDDERPPHY
jgi:uncharacterized coiled-coil protein SlyX